MPRVAPFTGATGSEQDRKSGYPAHSRTDRKFPPEKSRNRSCPCTTVSAQSLTRDKTTVSRPMSSRDTAANDCHGMRPYSLPAPSGGVEPLAGHDNVVFPRQAAYLSPAEHLTPTDNTVRHCGYRTIRGTASRRTNRKKPVNRLKDDFRLLASGFFARPEEKLPDFPPNSPETGIFNPVSMRSSGLFSPLSSIPFPALSAATTGNTVPLLPPCPARLHFSPASPSICVNCRLY